MKNVLIAIFVMMLVVGTASAWLSGYDHRMAITVNNGGASTLNYYQFNFTNDTNTLVAAGHMLASGGDCRITDSSDNLIPCWNETAFNAAGTKIYANATTLAVGDNTFYMYYGNSAVSSVANGDNTFEHFDDFSNDPLIDWTLDTGIDYSHFGIIVDGFHYSTIYYTNGRIAKVDITSGVEVDNLSVDKYTCCAPIISGGWLYMTLSGGNLYRCNTSNLADHTTIPISFNDLSETMAYDDTYFYNPESAGIHKRYLDNMTSVDSYSCSGSRGVLRIGDILYHITSNGIFHAVHTSNMTELWNIQLNMTDFKSYCVPIYDETHNRIYVVDSNTARTDGYTYAINPTTHAVDWYVRTGQVTTTPTYYNNKLFVSVYGGSDDLMALDVTNSGSEIWSKTYASDDGWGGWTADDNYLYQVTHGNAPVYFRIVDQSNGDIVHEESLTGNGKPCTVALLTDGRVIASSMDPAIRCFEVGAGSAVDFDYYHGNQYYTGHVSNAITSYNDFSTPLSTNWVTAGTPTVSNGILTLDSNSERVTSKKKWNRNATHRFSAMFYGDANPYAGFQDATTTPLIRIITDYPALTDCTLNTYVSSHVRTDMGDYLDAFYTFAIAWKSGEAKGYVEDSLKATHTTQIPTTDLPVQFVSTTSGHLQVNWTFVKKYSSPEPTSSLGVEEDAPHNDIVLAANQHGMLRKNVTAAETFSTIAAGIDHDRCYTWWDSTNDRWETYRVGYSYNAAMSVPEHDSYFVLMDGTGTTISCVVATAETVSIPSGWYATYLRESTSKTLTAIKTDMGGNVNDLWAFDSTAGAWVDTGAYSVLPNQGLMLNSSTGFSWDGSVP